MRRRRKWKEDNKRVTEVKELRYGVFRFMAFSGILLTPSSGEEMWWQEVKNLQCAHTHTHFFSHTLLTIPPHAAVCIKSAFTIRCSKEVWWSVTSGSNLSWLRQLKCLSDYSLTVYILTMRCVCLFVTFIHQGKSVFLESVHYLSILDHTVWLLLELESAMGDFLRQPVDSNYLLVLICRGLGQFLIPGS